MDLYLHGNNFNISDPIRDYVDTKFGKLTRFLPDLRNATIEIKHEETKSNKDKYIVQATLNASGSILRAEERTDDVYAGIDLVASKAHRQIARYKGKREDRWHSHAPDLMEMLDAQIDADILAELEAEEERTIARTKQFLMSPMSEEEAIEQMELLGHNFFVFFNADLGRVNVLYHRRDKNYGLLDPQLA